MAPTRVRYLIVGLTTCVAVLLYVDRFCLGFVAPYIRENLGLSPQQMAFVLDVFFYTYAFGQIPCGWLADRYGARTMLALYLAVWSALTGLMGLAQGMTALVMFRLGCGLFESGAYPASAGLIRRWVPYQQRGLASGIVSIGGRIGGAVVPLLTAFLMVGFVPVSSPSGIEAQDILDVRKLAVALAGTDADRTAETTLGSHLAPRIFADLPPAARKVVEDVATTVDERARALASQSPELTRAQLIEKTETVPLTGEQAATLAAALNGLLGRRDLVSASELEPYHHKLPAEAKRLAANVEGLTEAELTRLNRLVLEVAYPEALRKVYGEGWRPVLLIYGGVGLLLAAVYYLLVRDTPRQHPAANEAEARLVEGDQAAVAAEAATTAPGDLWRGIITSRSLWLSAFVQFGTNFGWVFLGNLLPTYLQQVHQVPEIERGWMVMLPFLLSLPMMIVGGWWTDAMTRRFGPRWGRALPLALTRLVASAAFFACLLLDAPWPITVALCVFSVVSDMGIPSIWAFCLDVGGKNTGLVLGWGNMWGNLGAAVSTTTLVFLQSQFPGEAGWDAVFLSCGLVFLVIGVASFGIDATRPIAPAPRPA